MKDRCRLKIATKEAIKEHRVVFATRFFGAFDPDRELREEFLSLARYF